MADLDSSGFTFTTVPTTADPVTKEAVSAVVAATALATYEAVSAVPNKDPVNDPVVFPVIFNEPDTLTEPDKIIVSSFVPNITSYTSEIKLADINPPDVI